MNVAHAQEPAGADVEASYYGYLEKAFGSEHRFAFSGVPMEFLVGLHNGTRRSWIWL